MKIGNMLITQNNGSGSRVKDYSTLPETPSPSPSNFLELCLESYFQTTAQSGPFIVVDDGSTDDSLEIIHRYAPRITRIIAKEKNCGLVRCMNEAADLLIGQYGCDAVCRFDADIEFLAPGWDIRFVRYFENNPRVAAVGGLQLLPFGAVWALGDMLIHPEGYTHILNWHNATTSLEHKPPPLMLSGDLALGNVECDSVMGCLAAFRASAYAEVGGQRAEFDGLRGETEDLNLRLLLAGHQCVALGGVPFIHRHWEYRQKTASYDAPEQVYRSLTQWKNIWGWDKIRPDLKDVYEKWQGTPLARNLLQTAAGEVIYIGP